MIAHATWACTLALRCDGCAAAITVTGCGIPECYDAAELAGWKCRARIGRHYCAACVVPESNGRGTTFTQDKDGKAVVR